MNSRKKQQSRGTSLWVRAARSPWTVACVVAAVVVGPSAVTASALDRANAAPPLHGAPRTGSLTPDAGSATAPHAPAW
ncbi:hypothetical protein FE633_28595 [Streptomyces montanus]|uniref:Uncharacterized protein n=1 Tax=Streptomyces montanus TaxID=2580423 RepID=A0A5R9FL77_9ACTN|nr:hypothetical protein [Streptomyces montanus]TLS42790.1 hypothetical protein FE633_28595 [Streptomyces montanus]